MKYKEYNDSELLSYIKEQNEEANEIIYEKYKPFIINLAKKEISKCSGIEINDLIQEGMLGLTQAISSYDETCDVIFYTYAKTCIKRAMATFIKKMMSSKNKYLNDAISYENTTDEYSIEEKIGDNTINPEYKMVNAENKKELYEFAKDKLTTFEYEVFSLKMREHDYKEIAAILNKNSKEIDTALPRIKNKLSKK